MEYSEIILKVIENFPLTTYAVSKATGITESTFSNWRKKPTSKMDMSNVIKIANFLDVTIDYLLTGKEPQTKELPLAPPYLERLYDAISRLTRDECIELTGTINERTRGRSTPQSKAV